MAEDLAGRGLRRSSDMTECIAHLPPQKWHETAREARSRVDCVSSPKQHALASLHGALLHLPIGNPQHVEKTAP